MHKEEEKNSVSPKCAKSDKYVLGGEKWSAVVHFKSLFVDNLFEKYVTE